VPPHVRGVHSSRAAVASPADLAAASGAACQPCPCVKGRGRYRLARTAGKPGNTGAVETNSTKIPRSNHGLLLWQNGHAHGRRSFARGSIYFDFSGYSDMAV